MKQLVSYKYRIYPSEEQQVLLSKTFGCKRFIFNHYLSIQQERYKNKEKHLSHFDINKDITQLKKTKEWLKEVDSQALCFSAEDLSIAYTNFFKSIAGKRKGKKLSPPKFKNKHSRQSYRTTYVKILDDKSIHIPKLKSVKAVIHKPIPDSSIIKSATISKDKDGRYYASILIETEVPLQPMTGKEVGCDVGLKHLLITSDGIKFKRPDVLPWIVKTKQLLKVKQRQFARTKKSSINHGKLRLKIARLYSKITRQRNEYYHMISKYLVNNYDSIFVEDLNVNGMLQNKKLSRAIHEVSWSTLTNMIRYKANWSGRTYHRIDRFVPTSKTCSVCDHKLDFLSLGTRTWKCICGNEHDRDINAAKNILRTGQRDLYEKVTSQTTGDVGMVSDNHLPKALQKMTDKIERSVTAVTVGHGSKQTT